MQVNSTNSAFGESQISLNKAKEEEKTALKRIADKRPLEATDGSNLAIADSLLAQANSMAQGIRNANDAIGVLQIADATLSNVTATADRINELSVRLGNPVLTQDQRNMVINESQALTQSINDAVDQATFNGKNVFSGEMSFMTANGVESIMLQRPETGQMAVTNQQSVLDFLQQVNSKRVDIGSAQMGIESGINSSMVREVNVRAAEGNLQKDDLAENYNDLNRAILLGNATMFAQSHNAQYLKSRVDQLLA